MEAVAIAIAILVLVGISLGIVFAVLIQRMKAAGRDRLQVRFPAQTILRSDLTANFFGLESRGRRQVRGNGVLALTSEELWFSRFTPRNDLAIPLSQIETVRLITSHLGKRIFGRQLLYIQFQTPEGTDAAAWLVAQPEEWQAAIAAYCSSLTDTRE